VAVEAEAETVGSRPSFGDLASELAGIAARMSAMASRPNLLLERGASATSQIRTLLQARHKRSAALGLDLVHPGWSLLLVLFRAHLEDRPIRMARLATDAHVSMTATMRWTGLFLDDGLAERRSDPASARGVLFALSAEGVERVRRQLIAEKW
jgi:DNA-binding MarR family transcriptional regulator